MAALVRQFGTPTFVYDAAMIRRRIADLAAFDVVRYAQKACSNLAILDLVRRHGHWSTRSAPAKFAAPWPPAMPPRAIPPPIVYTADIFDAASLDLCVEHNIHVNCGSPDMIDQFGGRAPGRQITLRINPGFGHGHSQKTNTGGKQAKHGIWFAQIADCVTVLPGIAWRSAGCTCTSARAPICSIFRKCAGRMEKAATAVGPSLVSISVGGGLPTVYRATDRCVDLPAYFALCDAMRKRLQDRFGQPLRLEIEPGRYLVAESGYLVAEIRAVKRQDDNTFYLLDAGFNNLARPILYGAYHPMSIVPADGDSRGPSRT